MRHQGFGAACVLIAAGLFVPRAAEATDYTWKGVVGESAWSKATNWLPEGVPTTGDNVTIGNNYFISITESVNLTTLSVGNSTLDGSVRLSVFTLSANGLVLTGSGTLTIVGSGTVNAGTTQAGLQVAGWTLENNGLLTVTSGNRILFQGNSGGLNNRGIVELRGGSGIRELKNAPVCRFDNFGALRKTGSGTAEVTGIFFTNTNSGSVVVDDGVLQFFTQGGSVDVGAGPFTAVSPSSAIEFYGKLALEAGATFAGDGFSRALDADVTINAVVVVARNFEFGTASASGSGILSGPGNLDITGTLKWSAGALTGPVPAAGQLPPAILIGRAAKLEITGGAASNKLLHNRRMLNNGAATWEDGGSIRLRDAGSFENLAGARLEAKNDATFSGTGSPLPRFNNAGSFVKSASPVVNGSTLFNDVDFNNTGSVSIDVGKLQLAGGTSTGSFVVLNGTTLEFFSRTHTVDTSAAFAGAGQVRVMPAATLTVKGSVRAEQLELTANATDGAVLDGPGDLTISRAFLWTGGSIRGGGAAGRGRLIVSATGTLTISEAAVKFLHERLVSNFGKATWSRGEIRAGTGAIFTNEAGADFDVQLVDTFGRAGGALARFDNLGTLRKTLGITGTAFVIDFNNRGTVDVSALTSLVFFGGSSTGKFTLGDRAETRFIGSVAYLIDSGTSFQGQLGLARVVGGLVSLRGTSQSTARFELAADSAGVGGMVEGGGTLQTRVLDWRAGGMRGSGRIDVSHELNILTDAPKTQSGFTVTSAGEGVWLNAGTITMADGALFENTASGTFEIRNDSQLLAGTTGAAPIFRNRGTFRKLQEGAATTFHPDFVNSGEVEIAVNNTLDFRRTYVQESGATRVSGVLIVQKKLERLAGVISGTGIIRADVSTAGGTSPGRSPGILSIAGAFTQYASGRLDIEIGGAAPGTQHDQLRVSGAATFGGTLSIAVIDGFVPAAGQTFSIVTAGSIAGAFAAVRVSAPDGVTLRPVFTATGIDLTVTASTAVTVSGVSPAFGPVAGGTAITIAGANFASGAIVTIGGAAATSVRRLGSTRIAAVTPAQSTGARDVAVRNPNGDVATLPAGFTYLDPSTDTDGDGMKDLFERQFELDPASAADASADADGDGIPNGQEALDGTHPRGFFTRHLAEGASSSFFELTLALVNAGSSPAITLLRFLKADGTVVPHTVTLHGGARATIEAAAVAGLSGTEFSTTIESDHQVVVDRTMRWADGRGYGSHAETSTTAPATEWYLAEGATHSNFNLFYLLQNPGKTAATVSVTYLLPSGGPIVRSYTVGPNSRFNIWVNREGAALASTDVSAVFASSHPIIVERAMYRDLQGQIFGAGHNSAAVRSPATSWFLAEGATGSYFDLFVLIANPGSADASIAATFLLPDGGTVSKSYTVPASSRFNIWVDLEDARLANTAVSTSIVSTNGVGVIVERAMWWPGTAATWHEAHNSPGSTETGTKWALAEGESGGPANLETYVLIANTGPSVGSARVTLLFEDGTTAEKTFALAANSRFNVNVSAEFAAAAGRRFGAVIESLGTSPSPIVVERAMYSDAGGVAWAAGTNAAATRLQ